MRRLAATTDAQLVAEIRAAAGHLFMLPGGGTSVLYIGKGTSREALRRRLREHRTFTQNARDGRSYAVTRGW
jgi:hypothetical protein